MRLEQSLYSWGIVSPDFWKKCQGMREISHIPPYVRMGTWLRPTYTHLYITLFLLRSTIYRHTNIYHPMQCIWHDGQQVFSILLAPTEYQMTVSCGDDSFLALASRSHCVALFFEFFWNGIDDLFPSRRLPITRCFRIEWYHMRKFLDQLMCRCFHYGCGSRVGATVRLAAWVSSRVSLSWWAPLLLQIVEWFALPAEE